MGPQHRLGIYVGFDSSAIIRYLEPLTGDVFRARFTNSHFNETVFPPLGGKKSIQEERQEITWNASTLSHFDPRTNQCELEVQMIIHLHNLANQLPDAFVDAKKVTKSHIPVANALARINVHEGPLANDSKIRLKRGRPIGSKDVTPRKRRTQMRIDTLKEVHDKKKKKKRAPIEAFDKQKAIVEAYIEQKTLEGIQNKELALEEAQVPENFEISINYVHNREKWDRNKVIINNIFVFQIALGIIRNDENPEPQNEEECRNRND